MKCLRVNLNFPWTDRPNLSGVVEVSYHYGSDPDLCTQFTQSGGRARFRLEAQRLIYMSAVDLGRGALFVVTAASHHNANWLGHVNLQQEMSSLAAKDTTLVEFKPTLSRFTNLLPLIPNRFLPPDWLNRPSQLDTGHTHTLPQYPPASSSNRT